ncbi:MAG: hypothetical protein KAT79_00965 [candidate division Zixibacteria bacterium]|nr:hypothetical protein [candidate division Zixibacteria bacterium]
MRTAKPFIFLLFISLVLAVFASAPVFSGENPWDADRGDPGGLGDTVIGSNDGDLRDMFASDPGGDKNWVGDITLSLSLRLTFWMLDVAQECHNVNNAQMVKAGLSVDRVDVD